MNAILARIFEIAIAAANVPELDRAEHFLELIKVGALAYKDITGKPVDVDLVPHIEKIT